MTPTILEPRAIRLGLAAADRFVAVRQAGQLLLELGAVAPGYVEAMVERERMLSSYVGEGFALPHGTDAARALVHRAALGFLQYPDGIDWDGQQVNACIAIAASADEHVTVMARLATVLLDPQQAQALRTATDPRTVLELIGDPDPV